MQKKILFVLAAFLMVFAMGCITIETYHKQNADGSAVITQTMDLSGYYEYMQSMEGMEGTEGVTVSSTDAEDFEAMCDDVPSGVTCTTDISTWTVTMEKTVSASEAFYEFETSGDLFSKKYKLTIDELPNFGEVGDEETGEVPSGSLTSSENAEGAVGMQQMGMEWTYVVEMPGKITSAQGGDIDDDNPNVATFDVLDMMSDQEPIVVEAEGSGLGCLPGVVLLLAVFGFVAINTIPK